MKTEKINAAKSVEELLVASAEAFVESTQTKFDGWKRIKEGLAKEAREERGDKERLPLSRMEHYEKQSNYFAAREIEAFHLLRDAKTLHKKTMERLKALKEK